MKLHIHILFRFLFLFPFVASLLNDGRPVEKLCRFAEELHRNKELRRYIWMKARSAIGLTQTIKENDELLRNTNDESTLASGHTYRSFYNFFNNDYGFSAFNISGKPVIYIRMWKSGNNRIRGNLFDYHDNSDKTPKAWPDLTWCGNKHPLDHSGDDFHRFMSHYWEQCDHHGLPPLIPKFFTFIRDPLSRWISGMREYYERPSCGLDDTALAMINKTKCPHLDLRIKEMYTASLMYNPTAIEVEAYAKKNILHINHQAMIRHLFPQSTSLHTKYLQSGLYIGRVANITSEWESFTRDSLGIGPRAMNSEIGMHSSSHDTNGVEDAIRGLFTADERYLQSVCWLLIPDYICFKEHFTLPGVCSDIPNDPNIRRFF